MISSIRRSPRDKTKENLNESLSEIGWLLKVSAEGHDSMVTPQKTSSPSQVLSPMQFNELQPATSQTMPNQLQFVQPLMSTMVGIPDVKQASLASCSTGHATHNSIFLPVSAALLQTSHDRAIPSQTRVLTVPLTSIAIISAPIVVQSKPLNEACGVEASQSPNASINTSQSMNISQLKSELETSDEFDIGLMSPNDSLCNEIKRPRISYAVLITQAIQSQPSELLTLSGIYDWIKEYYPFFKTAEKGWKNSIRHTLSLNNFFVKVTEDIKL